jgi:hypothetical protein
MYVGTTMALFFYSWVCRISYVACHTFAFVYSSEAGVWDMSPQLWCYTRSTLVHNGIHYSSKSFFNLKKLVKKTTAHTFSCTTALTTVPWKWNCYTLDHCWLLNTKRQWTEPLVSSRRGFISDQLRQLVRPFTPIKRPLSVLPSCVPHQSPWELTAGFSQQQKANNWALWCDRKIFFPWLLIVRFL